MKGADSRQRYRGCDEIAYNAYKSFQAAGATVKAEAVKGMLLDPHNELSNSPLAKRLAAEARRQGTKATKPKLH